VALILQLNERRYKLLSRCVFVWLCFLRVYFVAAGLIIHELSNDEDGYQIFNSSFMFY